MKGNHMLINRMVTPTVFRDCRENNGLANKVPSQPDIGNQGVTRKGSNSKDAVESKNPGAAATASGEKSLIRSITSKDYLDRLEYARNLQAAIAACDPAVAAIIMDRALDDLRIGEPGTALLNAMDQAVTWAAWATPAEHKAYCLASFNAMPPKARASFLHYVRDRAA